MLRDCLQCDILKKEKSVFKKMMDGEIKCPPISQQMFSPHNGDDVYISSICRTDNFIYPPTIYTLYFDVLIFVCVRRIKCNKRRAEKTYLTYNNSNRYLIHRYL